MSHGTPAELLARTEPVSAALLATMGFTEPVTTVELPGGEMYELVSKYVAVHGIAHRGAGGFTMSIGRSSGDGMRRRRR